MGSGVVGVSRRSRTLLDGITIEEFRRRANTPPEPTGTREFRCSECGARCTRMTDGAEAGHALGCSRRLSRLGKGKRGRPLCSDGGEEVSER